MTGVADIEASSLYTTGNITTDGNLVVSTAITMTGGSPYISGVNIIEFNGTSGVLSAGDTANEKLLIRAQDTDGGADVSFITLTSNPTPTCDLDDSVTKGGQYIYRAGGTNVAVADGGTGADDATNARSNLNAQVAIAFQDEGTITGTTGAISIVNFVGAGVSAAASGSTLTVTISGTAGTGYDTIQEEGSGVTQRTTMNFIGSGITAADNSTNSRTNITLDAMLNSIADITATTGVFKITSTDTVSTFTVSAFGETLVDDADATAARSTLGVVIGTNVQAYDATLAALASYNTNGLIAQTAADTFAGRTLTGGGGITVSNGDGVSGNPTLSISNTRTIWIPAAAMKPSASGGCATLATVASAANQPDITSLDFDSSTAEYAQFSVRFPKSWDEGTITAVFHWSHAATTTNFGVRWGLQGVAVSDDDAIAVAYGTAQEVTDTGGTTNDLYVSAATSAITIGGSPAVGDQIFFRTYRDPANGGDTMAIDARLMGVVLFYTVNTLDDA